MHFGVPARKRARPDIVPGHPQPAGASPRRRLYDRHRQGLASFVDRGAVPRAAPALPGSASDLGDSAARHRREAVELMPARSTGGTGELRQSDLDRRLRAQARGQRVVAPRSLCMETLERDLKRLGVDVTKAGAITKDARRGSGRCLRRRCRADVDSRAVCEPRVGRRTRVANAGPKPCATVVTDAARASAWRSTRSRRAAPTSASGRSRHRHAGATEDPASPIHPPESAQASARTGEDGAPLVAALTLRDCSRSVATVSHTGQDC